MVIDTTARLHSVDRALLTPLVRQALHSATVEVDTWQVHPLHGGLGGGTGRSTLDRFTGTARDGQGTVTWSLVRKLLPASSEGQDPAGWQYWEREALAYASGWLDAVPGPLTAPRCFGTYAAAGDGTWLWLEDLSGAAATTWAPARYAVAARHLGAFMAPFSARDPARPMGGSVKRHAAGRSMRPPGWRWPSSRRS